MRNVNIRPVLNGWVIQVGCSEIVMMDKNVMVSELLRYLDNPNMVEREYQRNAVNSGIGLQPVQEGITRQNEGTDVPQCN